MDARTEVIDARIVARGQTYIPKPARVCDGDPVGLQCVASPVNLRE
jgi:hypothetical protein